MRKLSYDELAVRRVQMRPARPHPVCILVENVRSLHNVGSILRTADAAGIEQVICCGITGSPAHPAVHKTALGAQDTVAWTYVQDARHAAEGLRARGYALAALELTDTSTSFDALGLADFPLCLILGNEVDGVSEALLDLADLALQIPQYGSKQSLNVSVACGIAVFRLVERYRQLSVGLDSPSRQVLPPGVPQGIGDLAQRRAGFDGIE